MFCIYCLMHIVTTPLIGLTSSGSTFFEMADPYGTGRKPKQHLKLALVMEALIPSTSSLPSTQLVPRNLKNQQR
jgi:hypothetical protein